MDEIKKLRVNAKPSLAKELDFAVSFAKRCALVDTKIFAGEDVDDHIIRIAHEGGYIVAEGTPEQVARVEASYTGRFLQEILASPGR